MLTRWMISLGCFGDGDHSQRLDNLQFEDKPEKIVFRRSVPHGGRWTQDFTKIRDKIEQAGYRIVFLFITRDTHFNALSQVRRSHAPYYDKAREKIKRAEREIPTFIEEYEHIKIQYEFFVTSGEVRDSTRKALGLSSEVKGEMRFFNANKHYDKVDS